MSLCNTHYAWRAPATYVTGAHVKIGLNNVNGSRDHAEDRVAPKPGADPAVVEAGLEENLDAHLTFEALNPLQEFVVGPLRVCPVAVVGNRHALKERRHAAADPERVSRTADSPTDRRETSKTPANVTRNCPPRAASSAAKSEGLSSRGQHSQSMLPCHETSPIKRQWPRRASSEMA